MPFSKKEIKHVLIMAFIAALIFSFKEWGIDTFNFLTGIKNLLLAFVFCLVIYFFHAFSQKLTASRFNCSIKFELFQIKRKIKEIRKTLTLPIGPIITLLVTFLSNGSLFFIMLNTFHPFPQKTSRLGRKWINIKEFEIAQIALSGPLSQIILLILFKLLLPLSQIFNKAMFITSTICIFNMLPLPKADGSQLFFSSRPLYLTSLIFIILFIILIFHLSILQTIMLSLILSLIAGIIYLYKSNS